MVHISKISIENFRSIKLLNLDLNQGINAFIGRNNAGKSNILRAIQILLDEKWPAYAITEDDLPNYDNSLDVKIEIILDEAILYTYYNITYNIYGIRLTFNKNEGGSLVVLDENSNPITNKFGYPIKVGNDFREKIPIVYVGIDRNFSQHLSSDRWNSWNGLLYKISKQLSNKLKENEEEYKKFKEAMAKLMQAINTEDLNQIEDQILNETKSITGAVDVETKFREPEIDYFYKSLLISIKEGGFEPFPAMTMGTGFQNGLVVALSRVYNKLVGQGSILIIEEPEIYLHPQARKYFYSTLKRILQEGTQVIYTTHSSEFVSLDAPETINVVRKNPTDGTKVSQGLNHQWTDNEEFKFSLRFNTERNELFFSDRVMLVEGLTEKRCVPYAFQLNGFDINKENISIIDCDGADGIEFISNILTIFGIPFVMLADKDTKNKNLKAIEKRNEILSRIGNVFFLDPDFEGAFSVKKDETRSKVSSGLKRMSELKSSEELPSVIKEAIKKLLSIE